MSSHNIRKISLGTFNSVLSRYESAVPDKLRDLDAYRYGVIPDAYAERLTDKHLTHAEVEKLVEWKLKHGTFRPKLLQLVQSNDAEHVEQTTISALHLLPNIKEALKILIDLKGIGPATASLLLSVASPDNVPFFSDELFRWCMWDEHGAPKGWQRKIKYTAKEYEMLLKEVRVLRMRLGVKAVDAEKVAWVLGKEGVDVDEGSESGVDEEDDSDDEYTSTEASDSQDSVKDAYRDAMMKYGPWSAESGSEESGSDESGSEGMSDSLEETKHVKEEANDALEVETKISEQEGVKAEQMTAKQETKQESTKGTKRKAKPLAEGTRKSMRTKK